MVSTRCPHCQPGFLYSGSEQAPGHSGEAVFVKISAAVKMDSLSLPGLIQQATVVSVLVPPTRGLIMIYLAVDRTGSLQVHLRQKLCTCCTADLAETKHLDHGVDMQPKFIGRCGAVVASGNLLVIRLSVLFLHAILVHDLVTRAQPQRHDHTESILRVALPPAFPPTLQLVQVNGGRVAQLRRIALRQHLIRLPRHRAASHTRDETVHDAVLSAAHHPPQLQATTLTLTLRAHRARAPHAACTGRGPVTIEK